MLNFLDRDVALVAKAGFNVTAGYLGREASSLYYYSPHPFYDYDVLVFNSQVPWDHPDKFFPEIQGASQTVLEPLSQLFRPPLLRIVFTGDGPSTSRGGIPVLDVKGAGVTVSQLVIAQRLPSFTIPALHDAIAHLKNQISMPIGQYLKFKDNDHWPNQHFPVIANRNHDLIAAYGVRVVEEGRVIPLFVALPQLKDNATGLVSILKALAKSHPALFPDIRERGWIGDSQFALPEELAIDKEIKDKVAEAQVFIETKKKERGEVAASLGFLRAILTATEDEKLDLSDRLSTQIKKTLEFLDFIVEDIDAQIKGAIRKEDFWVIDGDFLAITEVTGTISKNPKSKEYNDILGRMNVIFRRSDLVPDKDKYRISGLLVINHDLETHPDKRPQLYGGALEEIVESAKDSSIGLLSTVELHRIAMAVKRGQITKGAARELIKQFGRIEMKINPEAATGK